MQSDQAFIDSTRERARQLDGHVPLIADARRTSVAEVVRVGIPSGKLETWKYTPIREFFAAPFATAEQSTPSTTQQSRDADRFLSFAGAAPILIRGAESHITDVPRTDGIDVVTLRRSAGQPMALNLGIDLERYPLVHLNTALLEDGLVIRIGAEIDAGTLDLRFLSGSSAANVSRVRIELGVGSRLKLIEQRAEDRPTNSVLDIHIGKRATLEHMRVLPPAVPCSWYLVSVHVDIEGTYELIGHSMGSKTRRTDIHVSLDGHHAKTNIDLAFAAHRRDRLDHQIVVEHIGVDTISRQIVHGIAAGASELTFNGRIHIHPGAQRSDARLTNKNLLVDRKAKINTKPELEIYANDVKCSHGATIGQIDPVQMFYLRTRGLDEIASRAMLTRAFLASRLTPWAIDAGVLRIYSQLFAL